MKKLFNNSYLVISLYLLLGFLIDIMTNITQDLSLSIGMILRGVLLLYLIVGIFIKYPKRKNFIVLGILLLYSSLYLITHLNISSLSFLLKYNFVIILSLFLLNMYKEEDKKVNRNMITLALIFYSLSIISYYLINTFIFDKTITQIHFKNIFNSINEISAIISIIVPYLIINLEKRRNFIEVFAIAIALIASILIGTRLPIISFLISILYLLIRKFISDIKNKKVNYTNLVLFILFIIAFIYKFNQTPLYKSLMRSVDKYNLNNPIDVFTNFKLFDSFIFTGRLSAFKVVINKLTSSSVIYKLFGLKVVTRSIQMDIFDLLAIFGAVGFVIFVFIMSYIIENIKTNRRVNYFPIAMIIVTSFLAGHTLLSPNVSIISIIILFNLLYKKRRKKILIASYDMGIGGIETASFNLINNLNDGSTEITLFLEHKRGDLLKKLPKDVIVKRQRVFEMKNPLIRKPLNMLNKLKFLITNFKEYDFGCCYATYSMSSNFLARYASNNSCIYIHSDYTAVYKNDVNEINKFFGVRKLDKFRHIVFVSNESKDNFMALYPRFMEKGVVINNFIDNKKILKLSDEKIKEVKPRCKTLFVFVGRIDNGAKNFDRMIKALSIVKESNKNIELWIIGSGPDEKLLKSFINDYGMKEYVKLLGAKLNPYPYMKKADYLLLTSNHEGFPVVYGEAITLGKKIISTIDVTDEAISIPNNFGYITKKDPEDIAKTIINVLKNDNLKYKKIDMDKVNNNKKDLLKKLISK